MRYAVCCACPIRVPLSSWPHRRGCHDRVGRAATAKAHREFQMRMLVHEQRKNWLKSEDEITEVRVLVLRSHSHACRAVAC